MLYHSRYMYFMSILQTLTALCSNFVYYSRVLDIISGALCFAYADIKFSLRLSYYLYKSKLIKINYTLNR